MSDPGIGLALHSPLPVLVLLVLLCGAAANPFTSNGLAANSVPVHLRSMVPSIEFGFGRAAAVLTGGPGGTLAAAGLSSGVHFRLRAVLPFLALVCVPLLPTVRRTAAPPVARRTDATVSGGGR